MLGASNEQTQSHTPMPVLRTPPQDPSLGQDDSLLDGLQGRTQARSEEAPKGGGRVESSEAMSRTPLVQSNISIRICAMKEFHMPRARKPTALHRLSGAIDHDPQRFRDRVNEPVENRALGDPPLWLNAKQRACWGEIERISAPGVLCHGDRLAVEMTAVLLAAFRGLGPSFPDAKFRRLEALLGQLGLTPAARSKVAAHGRQVPDKNKFRGVGRRPEGP